MQPIGTAASARGIHRDRIRPGNLKSFEASDPEGLTPSRQGRSPPAASQSCVGAATSLAKRRRRMLKPCESASIFTFPPRSSVFWGLRRQHRRDRQRRRGLARDSGPWRHRRARQPNSLFHVKQLRNETTLGKKRRRSDSRDRIWSNRRADGQYLD